MSDAHRRRESCSDLRTVAKDHVFMAFHSMGAVKPFQEACAAIDALADALAEKERMVLELQEARNNDFVAEVATGAEIKERIATLERENAALLKRAEAAERDRCSVCAGGLWFCDAHSPDKLHSVSVDVPPWRQRR